MSNASIHTPAPAKTAPDLAKTALAALLAGLVAGALAAALERDPALNYKTFLYGSFASGSIGLWTFCMVAACRASRTPAQAAVRIACFLGAVATTYYGMRYANFVDANAQLVAQGADKGITHAVVVASLAVWPASRWIVAATALLAVAVASFVGYRIVRCASRPGPVYWIWAGVPLLLLAFEGWCYFIPMLIWQSTSLIPAAVDVVGTLASAYMLLSLRRNAIEERIVSTLS